GGSRGGTGAALAANFAMLGTGSDTGQSIRSPASACSLVGVRPTRGLVSRSGIVPNSFTQDEAGPIARTVRDAAILLDVMAGYDPADPVTAFGIGKAAQGYAASLRPDALKGARIGVLSNLFGSDVRHAEVNRVMQQAMRAMEEAGATLVHFGLPGLDELLAIVSTDRFEAQPAFDHYLGSLGDSAPMKSFRHLVEGRTATPVVQLAMDAEIALGDSLNDTRYKDGMLARDKLRLMVAGEMAGRSLDAILYPLQRVLVASMDAAEQLERNGALSHGTGFPAVTFPAGFSSPSASAPIGVPVGAELLGRDYGEALLLSLALSLEQAAQVRRPPSSTPALA
ncbi:MAG: amidase family protein, partial [Ramlibacter sp.]